MDNPLKKILDRAVSFFQKTEGESVVGIDIGSSSIKVVQLKKKGGKAILETYGAVALGPYAESGEVGQVTNLSVEAITQALGDVLKESGVTTKNTVLSIPATASLIFTIELPSSANEKDFAAIVPTEARKYIPVPISEVSLDWWAIPKREEPVGEEDEAKKEKTEVLVTAIHNDTLAKYNDILKNANLQSSSFEIEVFSAIRSTFGHELVTLLLIDMGASKTKLSIIERGIVKQFHTVNRGAQDITISLSTSLGIPFSKAEELKTGFGMIAGKTDENAIEIMRSGFDYILSEINSVVLNYEKKYNKTVSKVILTGGGSLLKGFVDIATENFRSEVSLGNPFSKVETPIFLESVLKNIGPEFSVAVGLALRKLQ